MNNNSQIEDELSDTRESKKKQKTNVRARVRCVFAWVAKYECMCVLRLFCPGHFSMNERI